MEGITADLDEEEVPEASGPRVTHDIDVHGNAGLGQVAKIGHCTSCGRDNKIVGPRDFEPELRTCFGGCDSQKGMTPWEVKAARMGW